MACVSVVIPTFRRPGLLKAALESCRDQRLDPGHSFEIVVVDNSPESSARDIVDAFAASTPIRVRYIAETRTGIAMARNTGVAAAGGDFIAFLDDDLVAVTPDWLQALLRHGLAGAQLVFGPIEPYFEPDANPALRAVQRLFRRQLDLSDGADITRLHSYMSTSNSFFDKRACFATATPFAVELDGLGGEDTQVLLDLVRQGKKLVWASSAQVKEFVPKSRNTVNYLALRHFRNGQIRSLVHFRAKGPFALTGIWWMAVGLVQLGLYGPASLAMAGVNPEMAADLKMRAYGGAGKVLWLKRFWHRSYPSAPVTTR